MKRLVLLAVISLGACSKRSEEPARRQPAAQLAPLPAVEVQRGKDACGAYVAKVCACSSEEAKKACSLAKALPQALEIALETSLNPSTDKDNAMRAQVNVRETAKECIEQAAKLPALGCN
ncbi:hypothetical protein BH11MYX1_BH11MYX1_24540 [soil metagenome]